MTALDFIWNMLRGQSADPYAAFKEPGAVPVYDPQGWREDIRRQYGEDYARERGLDKAPEEKTKLKPNDAAWLAPIMLAANFAKQRRPEDAPMLDSGVSAVLQRKMTGDPEFERMFQKNLPGELVKREAEYNDAMTRYKAAWDQYRNAQMKRADRKARRQDYFTETAVDLFKDRNKRDQDWADWVKEKDYNAGKAKESAANTLKAFGLQPDPDGTLEDYEKQITDYATIKSLQESAQKYRVAGWDNMGAEELRGAINDAEGKAALDEAEKRAKIEANKQVDIFRRQARIEAEYATPSGKLSPAEKAQIDTAFDRQNALLKDPDLGGEFGELSDALGFEPSRDLYYEFLGDDKKVYNLEQAREKYRKRKDPSQTWQQLFPDVRYYSRDEMAGQLIGQREGQRTAQPQGGRGYAGASGQAQPTDQLKAAVEKTGATWQDMEQVAREEGLPVEVVAQGYLEDAGVASPVAPKVEYTERQEINALENFLMELGRAQGNMSDPLAGVPPRLAKKYAKVLEGLDLKSLTADEAAEQIRQRLAKRVKETGYDPAAERRQADEGRARKSATRRERYGNY